MGVTGRLLAPWLLFFLVISDLLIIINVTSLRNNLKPLRTLCLIVILFKLLTLAYEEILFIKIYIILILSVTVFYCMGSSTRLAFAIWMIPTRSLVYCHISFLFFYSLAVLCLVVFVILI